jgi:hypothetical protein
MKEGRLRSGGLLELVDDSAEVCRGPGDIVAGGEEVTSVETVPRAATQPVRNRMKDGPNLGSGPPQRHAGARGVFH